MRKRPALYLCALALFTPAISVAQTTIWQPEMIITFPDKTIACATADVLRKYSAYVTDGEYTKAQALISTSCVGNVGGPKKRFEILSVAGCIDQSVCILEIAADGKVLEHGAWTFSTGGQLVK